MRLTQIVEALLFASDAPLTAADIARIDERLDEDTVDAVVQELRAEYEETERAFQIYEVAGGYQLLTRPDFATYLERYETIPQAAKLSSSGLEVLAIIAYRQPIGRGEVEEIRGVGSSGSIKTLLDRNLIQVAGRGEGLGRPLLYGTTPKFLEHFGFKSLDDLPRPDELPVVLRTRTPAAQVVEPAGDTPAEAAADGEAAAAQAPADAAEAVVADDPTEFVHDSTADAATETADESAEIMDEHVEAVADEAVDDEADEAVTSYEYEPAEVDAVAQAGTEEEV